MLFGIMILFFCGIALLWHLDPQPASAPVIEASFLLGYGAFFLLCSLFFLSARPARYPFWDGRFFMSLHWWLALICVAFTAAHIGLFTLAQPLVLAYLHWGASPPMQAGFLGALAVLLCWLLSLTRPLRAVCYQNARSFRVVHGVLAEAALLLAAYHVIATRFHVNHFLKVTLLLAVTSICAVTPIIRRVVLEAPVARRPEQPHGQKRRKVSVHLALIVCALFLLMCLAALGFETEGWFSQGQSHP
ncbi:hypothetical protein HK13_04225 [Acetobacter indonesiensis]|nr:hypothetical protein HK13_04225 [Acetobacter indonesiensis]